MKKLLLLIILSLTINSSGQNCADFVWAKRMGAAYNEALYTTGIDASGNVYAIGTYSTVTIINTSTFTAAGGNNLFYATLNSSGTFGTPKNIGKLNGGNVISDGNGNVYEIGSFTNSITIGTYTTLTTTSPNIFITKRDLNGTYLWAKKLTNAGIAIYPTPNPFTIDASGNIYVSGSLSISGSGTLSIGTSTIAMPYSGTPTAFIVKFNSSGSPIWGSVLGSSNSIAPVVNKVVVDGSSNLYVTSMFTNSLAINSTTLTATGINTKGTCLSKLNSNGVIVYSKLIAKSQNDYMAIAGITSNSLIVTGTFSNSIIVGTTTLSSTGNSDMAIAKLDLNGNPYWVKKYGGTESDNLSGLVTDVTGNIFISNTFSVQTTMGTSTFTSGGSYDVLATKLDVNGNPLWSNQIKGVNYESGGLIIDNSNNIYCSGIFQNVATTSFGTGTVSIPSVSNSIDVFVSKISPFTINSTVTQVNEVLTASQNGAIYQWVDCNNSNAYISGATSKTYTATSNGSYGVIISVSSCSATSSCYTVSTIGVGIKEIENIHQAKIYPNPAVEELNIELINYNEDEIKIEVLNVIGQNIYKIKNVMQKMQIDTKYFAKGIYFLKIESSEGTSRIMFIKE